MHCIERLIENWMEHNRIIIAVDFDNTIYDFYNKGYTYDYVISLLKECKDMNCTLILLTCCDESKYNFILGECNKIGVKIDYINKSPEYIPYHSNKIYYNILLDDRAGLRSAYDILYTTKEIIKQNPKTKKDAINILYKGEI
jgi:hypothetical protein